MFPDMKSLDDTDEKHNEDDVHFGISEAFKMAELINAYDR